jgi:hypothetical protein
VLAGHHRDTNALGLHDVDACGDPVAIEDVGPFEAVELGTAESGVEGDCVGEAVLRLERSEECGGRLGCERDAHPGLLVVGWELDEAKTSVLSRSGA